MSQIELIGLEGIPEVKPGDRLAPLILAAARRGGTEIRNRDMLAVAQKVVSKAEGRLVRLRDVEPSAFAKQIAAERGEDARMVEVVLRESRRVVRMSERVMITETHHGFICANAGVDRSNISEEDCVSLLPVDPDVSARHLKDELESELKRRIAVLITDTFGRPWRTGLANVAIGVAGMRPLEDCRDRPDDFGRKLKATVLATADEVAAAAGLIMRKTRRLPVVIVRGVEYQAGNGTATELIRDKSEDLFR